MKQNGQFERRNNALTVRQLDATEGIVLIPSMKQSAAECSRVLQSAAECNRNQIAWMKGNKNGNNNGNKKPVSRPVLQRWRPPSKEECGKRIIYEKPYTWNKNTWNNNGS